jgi:hypothetical protein
VPTVDFVATGNARARAYNAIAEGLNSMTDYAYKRQVAATKREAAQYAFENPVTAQQIADAQSGGISLDDLVGDPDTVFGAVTRATTAQQVTAQLEGEARHKLSQWAAMIDGGADVDIEAMRRDITGMSQANTEIIGQLSPELATKYSASIAALASPVYKSALERDLKLRQSALKAKVAIQAESLGDALRNIYTQDRGAFVEGTTTLESIAAADVAISILGNSARSTNDAAYAVAVQAEAMKANNQIKRDVLSESVFEDAFATTNAKRISRVRKGDFGEKTALFNSLSLEDQSAVRNAIRERIDARIKDDDIQEKLLDKDSAAAFTVLAEKFHDAPSGPEQDRIVADMYEIARVTNNRVVNPTTINGLISSKRSADKAKKEPTKNPKGVGRLKLEIYEDKIQTVPQLEARALELDVTIEEWSSLITTIEKNKDADYRLGLREINRAAKIYPGSGQAPTQKQINKQINYEKKMDREFDLRLKEWEDGGMIGPRPSYVDIAKEITQAAQASKFQTAIDNKFRSYKTDFPSLSAYFTEQKFEDLEEILRDDDALRDFGLTKKQIKRLRGNYSLDVDFINEQISGRDGL